jgi:hypothetical protein
MWSSRIGWTVAAFLAASVLSAAPAGAQFAAGQRHLGAHLGLSGVGSAPALGVSGEVAYTDRISVGGWADTWSYGESYSAGSGSYRWDVRYVALAGTGAYHFPVEDHPKLDPFAGVSLGYFIVNTEGSGTGGVLYSGDASRLFMGGFGGVRYAFRERVAGVARVGFGASYLTLGVDYRL